MYLRTMSARLARTAIMTLTASAIACGGTATAPANPQPRHALAGTVTERAAGSRIPIEGVLVTHVATGRSARTDTGGGFVIHDVPAAPATLIATKVGYDIATASVEVSGDTRVDLLMVRRPEPLPNPTLAGVVYERSGAAPVPVAGAVVESLNTHRVSITDANGRYRLAYITGELGMTDGFDTIRVMKEGFATVVREVVPEGDMRLDIELVRQ